MFHSASGLPAHIRAAAFAAAFGIVTGFVLMLTHLFKRYVPETFARAITVTTSKPTPPIAPPRQPRLAAAPSPIAAPERSSVDDLPGIDPAALRRVLECLSWPKEREDRPRDCATLSYSERRGFWERPVGAPERKMNLDQLFTRSEQRLLPPPKRGIPVGPPPPPPTKTPEELCLDANMGGPCKRPPFRRADPAR